MKFSSGTHIGELFGDRFKSKASFKKAGGQILNAPVMFVDWSMLDKGRCPYCYSKLYQTYNRKLYLCRSKSHRKPFAISTVKLTGKLAKPRPVVP